MEYSQVTIALQASELTGPLGRPLVLVSVALDRNPQQFVILRNWSRGWFESTRLHVPDGPLTNIDLLRLTAAVDMEVYNSLLFYKGIQEELQIPPV